MKIIHQLYLFLSLLLLQVFAVAQTTSKQAFGITAEDLSLQNKQNITSLASQETILYYLYLTIFVFVLLSLLFVGLTIVRRIAHNNKQQQLDDLREKFQCYLAELVSGDYEDDMLKMLDSTEESNLALSLEDISTPLHRSILLEELLAVHKYIAGKSASKIRETYLTLGFKQYSLKQLKSNDWQTVVKGIQALSAMDIRDAYTSIFELIHHSNPKISEAAMVAHVQLSSDPLAFLDNFNGILTEWHHYRLHHALTKLSFRYVPDFERWFEVKNESVLIFVIKMSGLFQNTHLTHKLARFLSNKSESIQLACSRALAMIGTEEAIQPLIDTFQKTNNSQLKIEIIKTLEALASDENLTFFEQQFHIENADIQMAAAKAMNVIGEKSERRLEELKETSTENIQLLISHAQNNY